MERIKCPYCNKNIQLKGYQITELWDIKLNHAWTYSECNTCGEMIYIRKNPLMRSNYYEVRKTNFAVEN